MHHACIFSFCDVSLQKQIKWGKKERCICFCVLQSSPLEKGLSRQELFEALSGQKLKTPEGSKHKSKVQGGGGQGQSSDADSDVTVTTPEQVESRWSTPGAAAQSVRRHGQQQRSASTNI